MRRAAWHGADGSLAAGDVREEVSALADDQAPINESVSA
jgi:hypothetical protein